MKRTKYLLGIVLLSTFVSRAQSRLDYVPVLHFKPGFTYFLPPLAIESDFSASYSVASFSGKPIVQGKPYEAFFCKMEVRTEHYLGFGLRIHAGDYDRDTKLFIP